MNLSTSRRDVLRGLGLAALGTAVGPKLTFAQQGAQITIGQVAPPTSMDPHLLNSPINNAVQNNIWNALVFNDARSASQPSLAESWQLVDDKTWRFKLRKGVKFSNGSDLTVADVIGSLKRAANGKSASPFTQYARTIADLEDAGDGTLVIHTTNPDPILLNSLSRLRILSQSAFDAQPADFNSGAAAIGTGPFVIKSYSPGEQLVLVPNPHYWGPKPAWDQVTLKFVTDNGARLTGLLSKEFGLIETLPNEGIKNVESDKSLRVIRGPSSRVTLLNFDHNKEVSPFVTDKGGAPLKVNPFKDVRVRKAVAMAINKDGIIDRILAGNAISATQFMQPGGFGTSDEVAAIAYDANQSKALLKEAGYPDGFGVTLHGTTDRSPNEPNVLQAIAQMLARVGIATKVDLMPFSVFNTRAVNNEFSFSFQSYGVNTGETSNPLNSSLCTYSKEKGTGFSNHGRYSNAQFDEFVLKALVTMDDNDRRKLLANASKLAADDVAMIPLYNEMVVVGSRSDIDYQVRADGYILAAGVTKAA